MSKVAITTLSGLCLTKTIIRDSSDWHHSEFPHPLVTLDFDSEYKLISVEVVGDDLTVKCYDE